MRQLRVTPDSPSLKIKKPLSKEEKIICLADKFFSKSEHDLLHEKPLERVREMIKGCGEDKLRLFDAWLKEISPK